MLVNRSSVPANLVTTSAALHPADADFVHGRRQPRHLLAFG
jgi:hypothetical protein